MLAPFALILLTLGLSFLPAWFFVRRLRLDPLTRLLAAALISFTALYLLEFVVYLFSLPRWLSFGGALCLALYSAAGAWRRRGAGAPFPWGGVALWAGLAFWILALKLPIVVYGPGRWFGDWHEHYERSLFFLDGLPPDTRFLLGLWPLPARGPLFNAVAALIMGGAGRGFWIYQTLTSVLNTLPALPLALLLRDAARVREPSALLLSGIICAVAPFATQLEIYTNTKFFTMGFILGAFHLYRMGLCQERPWLAGWGFFALGAGFLAHHLTFVFALLLAPHCAYTFIRRRWRWQSVAYPGLAAFVLASGWFAFCALHLGWKTTLTANSTFGSGFSRFISLTMKVEKDFGRVFAGNLAASILPHSWRLHLPGPGRAAPMEPVDSRFGPEFVPPPEARNPAHNWQSGQVAGQGSLLGNLGWTGTAALILAGVLALRRRAAAAGSQQADGAGAPGPLFWSVFTAAGIPLNLLTFNTYWDHGLAHINLQPYVFLAIVLTVRLTQDLPSWSRILLGGAFLLESAAANAAFLALQRRLVPLSLAADGSVIITGAMDFNPTYVDNHLLKLKTGAVFLSDAFAGAAAPMSIAAAGTALALFGYGVFRQCAAAAVQRR